MWGDAVKHEGEGWVILDVHWGLADERDAAKLIPLLEAIGIPWVGARDGYEDWFGWNGKAMRMNEPPSDIFHEIGHWLCAAPRMRRRSDFGLARGAYHQHGPARWPDEEEAMASLLGILLERALGQPWEDTFCEHSWRSRDHGGGVGETLDMLRGVGLLRDMTPTCLRPLPRLPASSEALGT